MHVGRVARLGVLAAFLVAGPRRATASSSSGLEISLGAFTLRVTYVDVVDYGDQAALPRLSERLDALEVPVEAEHAFAPDQAIIEVASAIEDLGGTLTPDQRRKLERVRSRRNVFRGLLEAARASTPPPPVVATPKHGRNAPCWCGSGRKYKKCHLSEDEEGRAPAGGPPAGG